MIYIPIINRNGKAEKLSREFFTSEEGVKRFIKEKTNKYNDFVSCYRTKVRPKPYYR